MWISSTGQAINLAPETVEEEVIQNVRMILDTLYFTVPYDREFGVDGDALDSPLPTAKALSSRNIVDAIQQKEPRAVVDRIKFEGDALTGKLKPIVRIFINE